VARAERVFELAVQGRPQYEIAAEVGVSQSAVSKILRREYDRRLQRLPRERVRLLVRHHARYEYLYRLAHDGLDRSRADLQRRDQRRTTRGASDSGESTTVSVSTASAPGDPRWVREMLRALSEEQKLFQGNDFDWKALAMLFVEEEDGTMRVNEQFLTDANREVLRKAQVRPPNPTSSR
jgi:DNA-binding Lrp family transcriptional regulator